MHQIADTIDVDDDEILAVGIDDAPELADHGAISLPSEKSLILPPPSAPRFAGGERASPRWLARRRRRGISGPPSAAAPRAAWGLPSSGNGRHRRWVASPDWARIRRPA